MCFITIYLTKYWLNDTCSLILNHLKLIIKPYVFKNETMLKTFKNLINILNFIATETSLIWTQKSARSFYQKKKQGGYKIPCVHIICFKTARKRRVSRPGNLWCEVYGRRQSAFLALCFLLWNMRPSRQLVRLEAHSGILKFSSTFLCFRFSRVIIRVTPLTFTDRRAIAQTSLIGSVVFFGRTAW